MSCFDLSAGIKQILSAQKVHLEVFRKWRRAVARQAACGPVNARFPASLLQDRPDAGICINAAAAARPF